MWEPAISGMGNTHNCAPKLQAYPPISRKRKALLETTSIKTGKIAMMVGYRDTNYFSLAFKKHTGKSPTKYREEMQNT